MKEHLLTRRAARIGGALACFAIAVLSLFLAIDVARWREAMDAGDVQYRVSPGATGLWQPSPLVPGDMAEVILGFRDDVQFRSALRAVRLANLEDGTVSDPDLALRRNDAQARLEAIASRDGDRVRRSRAAGLLGVLGLARLASESQDRLALLRSTIANLELAIELDPANDEAKFNLELALQRGRGLRLEEASGGGNPAPGGAGAKGAGAGDPGTGY
jgi:hypothetical protein